MTAESSFAPQANSLFESFMSFPAPLAITDAEGRPQLLNAAFSDRFGSATLDTASLRAAAEGGEAQVRVRGGSADGNTVPVRAVRTPHSILAILSGVTDAQAEAQLLRLRNRVAELEELAATDHLTGSWNRAHFDRIIKTELARSLDARIPLSLILFDIDHFKRVNDTHGHAIGDAVLCEVAQRVRASLRSSDVLFRWGGEEFAVVVASAGYRHAETVAERLRRAMEDRAFDTAGRITISLGVAEHAEDEDAGRWFERLDAALYAAKNGGRNRVVVDRRGDSDAWAAGGGAASLHLVWQEGYECGNPTIDAEHRELFELANVLIDAAARSEPDPAAVRGALNALLTHVAQHFTDEEAILDLHRYHAIEEHRRAHAGLLRRAGDLKRRVERGEAGLGAIVEYLAQQVVARHLMVVDRAFFPLFAPAANAV